MSISPQQLKMALKDSMWRRGITSVLAGIGEHGTTRPFVSYAPFLVVWNLTRSCNLSCVHCYEEARTPAKDELGTEEALRAVDIMANAGTAYISLSGGEPLMRKDFYDIASYITERDMALAVASNGTLITRNVARRIADTGCRFIQISIDGATAQTHDRFRGARSFERAINGIKNMVETGITVGVATTITHHNLNEVEDIISLAEDVGAKMFIHYNFIPTGRAKNITHLDLSPSEREDLLNRLVELNKSRNISILSTAPQYSRVSMEHGTVNLTHFDSFNQNNAEKFFLAEFVGGCGAGRLYVGLEPNGDIIPCVFLPIKVGNILKDDLITLWQHNPILNELRDRTLLKNRCGDCKYVLSCGGCRARAYGYTGDYTECDPGCLKNQDMWRILSSEPSATIENDINQDIIQRM